MVGEGGLEISCQRTSETTRAGSDPSHRLQRGQRLSIHLGKSTVPGIAREPDLGSICLRT